ncbi:BON domain-containing protein [Flavisolibacter tropicus]|uniref:BON domain-containing protein n=1 Tax=Flavisolibacter tropicus TaxID=1492898 RepID=UPI00082AAFA6|nr:BON domain-containing protein [Flavisolibacter tropicus]
MADNNRNRGDQYYSGNQEWQANRNRINRNRDLNQYHEDVERFGNAGYSGNYNREDDDNRMDYGNYQGRVNYIPDNDDNRPDYESGDRYGNQYGGGYNQGSNMGQQRNQWGNQWGTSYGSSYGNQTRQSDQGNYGGQSGWRSVNDLSGGYDIDYNNRNENWRRGDRNWQDDRQDQYGNNSSRRHDVNYGGNAANDWNNEVRNKDDRSWWDRERRDVSSWMSSNENYREPRGNRNYPNLAGEHRGKGPRGYQRSEERIREDVCDRLSDDAMLDASEIEVTVNGADVVLSGTVLSREAKRHAEGLAESISGVRNVENRIHVGRMDELEGNYTTRQIIRAAGNNESTEENRRNKK